MHTMTPEQSSLIERTANMVKQSMQGAEGGHDWQHTLRVWRNARLIATGEPVDGLVVELAALLHDIADSKFHDGDEEIGPRPHQDLVQGDAGNIMQSKDQVGERETRIFQHRQGAGSGLLGRLE